MVFIANPAGQEGRQELLTEDPEGVSKTLVGSERLEARTGTRPAGISGTTRRHGASPHPAFLKNGSFISARKI
jgi:hypothetical protein